MSIATKLGNSKPTPSSDRWYATAVLPLTATTAHKKRKIAAGSNRPKRRFVLKAAAAAAAASGAKSTGAGSNRRNSAGGTKATRRPTDGVAVGSSVNTSTGARRQVPASVGTPGRIPGGVITGAICTTSGTPAAAEGPAAATAVGGSRVQGGNGGGIGGGSSVEPGADKSRVAVGQRQAAAEGGQENETAGGGREKRAAAAAKSGGDSGSGAESREEAETTDDNTLRPTPASSFPPSSTTTAAVATTQQEEVTGGGDERSREESVSRHSHDEENKSGEPASRTQVCGGDEPGAEKNHNGEGNADHIRNPSAVAEAEGGVSTAAAAAVAAAVPDVIVTANYVGVCQKGRARQMWKLNLEGGAIEGRGQVFVFDKCECWLHPPLMEAVHEDC